MSRIGVCVFSAVMLCCTGARATAQETYEAVRCLTVSRLRDIEVVDENRVLFYQSGGQVYLNVLAKTCEGLQPEDSLVWGSGRGTASRTTRLCSADLVSVLNHRGLGTACKLGEFRLIPSDLVKALLIAPGRAEESEATTPPDAATDD